jgi:hypothetical protein
MQRYSGSQNCKDKPGVALVDLHLAECYARRAGRFAILLEFLFVALLVAYPGTGSMAEEAVRGSLTFYGSSVPTNYPATVSRNRADFLTDGLTEAFPSWTKLGCAVWEGVSPIGIELRNSGGGGSPRPKRGLLKIHTTKASYAGIDFPSRIDVYTDLGADQWRHVGGVSMSAGAVADNRSDWLSVDINGARDSLYVVMHANGRYLAVDEMQFIENGAAHAPVVTAMLAKNKVFEDSAERVRQGVVSRARDPVGTDSRLARTTPAIWFGDPWPAILANQSPSAAEQRDLSDISGLLGEHQVLLVSIDPGAGSNATSISLSVDGLPADSLAFAEVAGVATANGDMSFDALVPVPNPKVVAIEDGRLRHFWVSVDLGRVGIGRHRSQIVVELGGIVERFDSTFVVKKNPRTRPSRLRAVNWAYVNDRPIFRDREAAFTDLEQHGIDVFVANPEILPGIGLTGEWEGAKLRDLRSLATRVRASNGILLLYLGWRAPPNLGDERAANKWRVGFRSWVKRISGELGKSGLAQSQWALYPFDEPDGEQLKVLGDVKQVLGTEFADVMIYADPSIADGGKISLDDLRGADHVVDIWQPNLGILDTDLGKYFRDLERPWWIYENPTSPAKRSSPFKDYLLLSWHARNLGAAGVGFWSYSDTTGSSAWNDFDGRRPDWAVVYESEHGPVSSRRWEAFRKGLEDYTLLESTSDLAGRDLSTKSDDRPLEQWEWRDRLLARKRALDLIK